MGVFVNSSLIILWFQIIFIRMEQYINLLMMMENSEATVPALFEKVGVKSSVLKELQNLKVEGRCRFIFPKKLMAQKMEEDNSKATCLLQISDQYVIQRSQGKTTIISAFKVDYQIKFEIKRTPSSIPNKIGECLGILFYFPNTGNEPLQLLIEPNMKTFLEAFGRVLAVKYIVQLGFHVLFKAIKKIGKGMTACVYNAINFANGQQVAIKSFKRSIYFEQDKGNGKMSFLKEFKMLTQLNHKNICRLYGVYESDNSTYVVLELYPLSLYGYIQKFGFPNLEEAKVIIINLLEGVNYIHSKKIMHRDLKLQNIMMKRSKQGKAYPVIIDFGLAEYTTANSYLYVRCGTPGYVAPEVLSIKSADFIQTYTEACDIFSLGIILHIIVFKKPLFQGKDPKEVIKKNCECNLDFSSAPYQLMGSEFLDLLKNMVERDPKKRYTARDCLDHPFLVNERKKLELQAENMFQTEYQLQY